MNTATATRIREACLAMKAKGIRLTRGPWFEFSGDNIVACCAIGAVLVEAGVAQRAEDLSRPGYTRRACELLGVNPWWLYRFWMGFDRDFQIMFEDAEDRKTEDDVSAFGIRLRKELST